MKAAKLLKSMSKLAHSQSLKQIGLKDQLLYRPQNQKNVPSVTRDGTQLDIDRPTKLNFAGIGQVNSSVYKIFKEKKSSKSHRDTHDPKELRKLNAFLDSVVREDETGKSKFQPPLDGRQRLPRKGRTPVRAPIRSPLRSTLRSSMISEEVQEPKVRNADSRM